MVNCGSSAFPNVRLDPGDISVRARPCTVHEREVGHSMHILSTAGTRARSLVSKAGRRRALSVGGTLAGAVVIAGAFSLPAGAALTAPANSTIIGSGSSTTYSMMQQLDTLFNSSPGCQQFVAFPAAPNGQPLDYSCAGSPTTTQQATVPENPYNDLAAEEAALGSSNGIQQLECQGAHGASCSSGGAVVNVANNQNYARSSRALKSSDLKGLNFTAYAEDGVTWFHYTAVAGTNTASNAVTNLTQAQLIAIYNGTDTNWNQVGGANAPIVVFSAQEGSGTQSTWKTFLGLDPSASTNPVNCYTPSGGSNTCVGPAVIFENEDAQILPKTFGGSQFGFVTKSNPAWGGHLATPNQIKSDAIFFFSNGKYNVSCKPSPKNCGGSPLGTGTTNAIGAVNGVDPTEVNVLDGQFPVDRFLYNIYSNGSNSNIPAATAATVNYVSEIGFMCNPNKSLSTAALDPNTGKSYISEVQSTILAAGFYPLSAGASSGTVNTTPIDEGTLGNPASNLLLLTSGGTGGGLYGYPDYKGFDKFSTTGPNGDPAGYCLSTTTDGNTGT
jgi:ABC-type phosphate transport system substrate-binding protein